MVLVIPKELKDLLIVDVPIEEACKKHFINKGCTTVGDVIDAYNGGKVRIQTTKFNKLKIWLGYQIFNVRVREEE